MKLNTLTFKHPLNLIQFSTLYFIFTTIMKNLFKPLRRSDYSFRRKSFHFKPTTPKFIQNSVAILHKFQSSRLKMNSISIQNEKFKQVQNAIQKLKIYKKSHE